MRARDGRRTALVDTWLLDEVRLAVQKGLKINEIYKVYEYDVTQYVPQTGAASS